MCGVIWSGTAGWKGNEKHVIYQDHLGVKEIYIISFAKYIWTPDGIHKLKSNQRWVGFSQRWYEDSSYKAQCLALLTNVMMSFPFKIIT